MVKATRLLRVRNAAKKKMPTQLRDNWFKKKRLGIKWRAPHGIHSKRREGERHHGMWPETGFRSPLEVRGKTRDGFNEVRVFNPDGLVKVNPKTDVAVIASTVGRKKRLQIMKAAEDRKITIANA